MTLAYWICVIITAVSAFVSLGYSIAGMANGRGASVVPSRYAASRSLALAIVAIVAFFTASIAFVVAIAVAMIIVQALDALVGAAQRSALKAWGPAVIAAVNLVVLIWMLVS